MILLANPLLIFRQQRPAGVMRAQMIQDVSLPLTCRHQLIARPQVPPSQIAIQDQQIQGVRKQRSGQP